MSKYLDGKVAQAEAMTLDEAIKHAKEVADSRCDACGAEHRQLAKWLKELESLREDKKQSRRREERWKNALGIVLMAVVTMILIVIGLMR